MSDKVSIVTSNQIPEVLASALRHHGYNFEAVPNIDMIDFKSQTIVIDTSMSHPDLKRCQDGILPMNKTSFYINLTRFISNDKKQVAMFLAKVNGDYSINYRSYNFFAESSLPTEYGDFILFGFESRMKGKNIIGLRTRELPAIPTIRTHSMCYTGDIFHSQKCDCREELQNAMKMINEKGGMIIYPEEEGRGVGILNKIKIYQHQERGADTVEAQYLCNFPNDLRDYDYLKDVFRYYGITEIRLITNNPDKTIACYDAGVVVVETIKLTSTLNKHNKRYLETKMRKNGHNFRLEFDLNLDKK